MRGVISAKKVDLIRLKRRILPRRERVISFGAVQNVRPVKPNLLPVFFLRRRCGVVLFIPNKIKGNGP